MMDKETLRKADIFSGFIIALLGAWIIWQALKMPMKDSWGGVQNVWFVSPAIFPLFVGGMITLLGGLLVKSALKTAGAAAFKQTLAWLTSRDMVRLMATAPMIRFFAIVALFFPFVFMFIPRIDFFVSSFLFLSVFIIMFHLDDETILKRLLFFYLAGVALFIVYFVSGLHERLTQGLPYPGDVLTLCFAAAFCIHAWRLIRGSAVLRKKFRTGLIVAVASPFLICPVFKYFLLVPMPTEGLVVALMDYIRYFEF